MRKMNVSMIYFPRLRSWVNDVLVIIIIIFVSFTANINIDNET